ncbi:MAG: DUF5107 domain-containing protein [Chlorobia bacterium]|nr:DUF5107 domain-containing protein [Fimbriimonadaceae bacterium]
MPVDLAEESVDLTIELLEAGPPTPESYPYPSLSLTGRSDQKTFRVVILENPFLRATIIPELGGRILRLEDKRTQTDVWPYASKLALSKGGNRGVACNAGLEILTGFGPRLNSMGLVSSSPDFSDDDEGPAGLWWGELCGNGLSLNVRYSMPPDEACIEIEVRAFNRTLRPNPYNGGFSFGQVDWIRSDSAWLTANGLLAVPAETQFAHAEGGSLHRFDRMRYLAPRQLDSWSVRLYPFKGVADLKNASQSLAVGWSRDSLNIQSSREILGGKIVVRTSSDASLELPADLRPEHLASFSLESVPDGIVELVVLDARKTELIRATELGPVYAGSRKAVELPPQELDSSRLQEETFAIAHRHLAHLQLGYEKLTEREYSKAAACFEQSLLFNAEDHLTWWIKAVAERLAGNVEEDRPELLNAHFLAPLEPALRAESYLASPSQAREKSAVLNPLEEAPETFIEIACLLIEANLLEEASKWIDESIRHLDMPMLRYLLAYAYLMGSRMEVQAAEQVQLAVRQQAEPPYPWRPVEIQALEHLAKRFPADGSLARMLAITSRT